MAPRDHPKPPRDDRPEPPRGRTKATLVHTCGYCGSVMATKQIVADPPSFRISDKVKLCPICDTAGPTRLPTDWPQ